MESNDDFVPKRPGRPPKYPWSEWTNGQVWTIFRYEHFEASVESMRQYLRMYASKHNLRVETEVDARYDHELAIRFQFRPEDAELPVLRPPKAIDE